MWAMFLVRVVLLLGVVYWEHIEQILDTKQSFISLQKLVLICKQRIDTVLIIDLSCYNVKTIHVTRDNTFSTFTSRDIERLALATNTSAIRSACVPGGRGTPWLLNQNEYRYVQRQ